MADPKLPPPPPPPPPSGGGTSSPPTDGGRSAAVPPPPPPPSSTAARRSRSGAFKHLPRETRDDRLQDFARTGFSGYRRVRVAEKRRRPAWIWLVLGLLVTAAAWGAYRWAQPSPDQASSPPPASEESMDRGGVAGARIDPDAWRSEIESMEAWLFASPSQIGPLGRFGERFSREAGSLVDRLRADGGAAETALAAELAELVERTRRSDFNVRRLKEARADWLALRARRLRDAEWLAVAADVDRTAELEVYRDAAEEIGSRLADTLAAGQDLQDSDLDPAERAREWHRELFYLRDALKVIRSGLPRRPPAGADADQLAAIHQIDRAFIAAEDVVARQGRLESLDIDVFETAIYDAEEAAAFFDRLGS